MTDASPPPPVLVGAALEHGVVGEGPDGAPVLLGSLCSACRTYAYPPRSVCWRDLEPMSPVTLSGRGTVYEAVRIALPPPGFAGPYWVAYVDLDEGPRAFAPLRWSAGEPDPVQGDRVRVQIVGVRRTEAGELVGPVFETECRSTHGG